MPVPNYESLMLPLLQFAADAQKEIALSEAASFIAKMLNLTDDDLKEMLPSGMQSTFFNRLSWASTYMKKAGLLEATRRVFFQITDRGKKLIAKQPKVIYTKFLLQYPEFQDFRQPRGTRTGNGITTTDEIQTVPDLSTTTPAETLEIAYENLRNELADELLARLKKTPPAFFERIVVELIVKMGYGGSRSDAGKALGQQFCRSSGCYAICRCTSGSKGKQRNFYNHFEIHR